RLRVDEAGLDLGGAGSQRLAVPVDGSEKRCAQFIARVLNRSDPSAIRPRPPAELGVRGNPKSPLESIRHLQRELVPPTERPPEKEIAPWSHHRYDLNLLGIEPPVEPPL